MNSILALFFFVAPASSAPADPLGFLLNHYSRAVDKDAVSGASQTVRARGLKLAELQADLSLAAEGLETFSQAVKPPSNLASDLQPFFKDHASSLNTIYRTLAVTDYTWAMRFPDAPCSPDIRRQGLLASPDGLFSKPGTGETSPWLAELLGPQASGKSAAAALDEVSLAKRVSARDHALLRARLRKITSALESKRAVGPIRAKLYCSRASAYETLAKDWVTDAASPSASALPTSSVVLIGVREGPKLSIKGAGVVVQTETKAKVLTDAGLGRDNDLVAFLQPRKGSTELSGPHPFKAEHCAAGICVGELEGVSDISPLKLTANSAAKDELVTAIGHSRVTGGWSVSEGLVDQTASGVLSSDAALASDMRGGAIINGKNELAGLFVLSQTSARLVAADAATLKCVIEKRSDCVADYAALSDDGNAGSSVLMTAAAPFDAAGFVISQRDIVESARVCWDGGCGLPSMGMPKSSGRPGGSAPSATQTVPMPNFDPMGDALSKFVGAMVVDLFSVPQPARAAPTSAAPARKTEKRKKDLKVVGLTLSASPSNAKPGESVALTANLVTVGGDDTGAALKAGYAVNFSVVPDSALAFNSLSLKTDESGVASVSAILKPSAKAGVTARAHMESFRASASIGSSPEQNMSPFMGAKYSQNYVTTYAELGDDPCKHVKPEDGIDCSCLVQKAYPSLDAVFERCYGLGLPPARCGMKRTKAQYSYLVGAGLDGIAFDQLKPGDAAYFADCENDLCGLNGIGNPKNRVDHVVYVKSVENCEGAEGEVCRKVVFIRGAGKDLPVGESNVITMTNGCYTYGKKHDKKQCLAGGGRPQ